LVTRAGKSNVMLDCVWLGVSAVLAVVCGQGPCPDFHAFPTRRSSDLIAVCTVRGISPMLQCVSPACGVNDGAAGAVVGCLAAGLPVRRCCAAGSWWPGSSTPWVLAASVSDAARAV